MVCKIDNHDSEPTQYCKYCKKVYCFNCLEPIDHPNHDMVSLIDNNNSSIKTKKDLENLFQQNTTLKEKYEKTIESTTNHYNLELEKVNKFFKEFHDLLHVQEVGIKRELKSYLEDDHENLIIGGSTLDYQLEKIQSLLSNFDDKNNNNNNNSVKYVEALLESENFLKETSNSVQNILSNNLSRIYTFHSLQSEKIEEGILTGSGVYRKPLFAKINELGVGNRVLTDSSRRYFYCYGRLFERYEFDDLLNEKVIPISGDTLSNRMYLNSRQSTMVSTYQNLFIFCYDCYYKYSPDTNSWLRGIIPNQYNGGVCQGAVYDGKSHIYIFGGKNSSDPNHANINRFNIETNVYELQYSTLQLVVRNPTPIVIDDNVIYLISGYGDDSSMVDYINCFYTDSKTTIRVADRTSHGNIPSMMISAVYLQQYLNIYILTYTHEFYAFNLETQVFTKLATPFNYGSLDSKILYDHNNSIYLLPKGVKPVHRYDIINNTWTKLDKIIENFDFGVTISRFD